MSDEHAPPGAESASAGDDAPAPSLEDSLRRLEQAGREGLGNAAGTVRALRMLVAADVALAWGALGRAVAWIAVGIAFGASSWLLLMGVLIAALQSFGLSWLAAMAVAAGLSLLYYGIETGNADLLKRITKGATPDAMARGLLRAKQRSTRRYFSSNTAF